MAVRVQREPSSSVKDLCRYHIAIWCALYAQVCLSSLSHLYILNSLPLIILWAFEKFHNRDRLVDIIGNYDALKT